MNLYEVYKRTSMNELIQMVKNSKSADEKDFYLFDFYFYNKHKKDGDINGG